MMIVQQAHYNDFGYIFRNISLASVLLYFWVEFLAPTWRVSVQSLLNMSSSVLMKDSDWSNIKSSSDIKVYTYILISNPPN